MLLSLSMMTSHKDLSSDYLVSWPIVDNGMSSKLLTATGAFEITLSVIRHNHVGVTLYECPSSLFFVAVEQTCAFSAMHGDCVCFSHVLLLSERCLYGIKFGRTYSDARVARNAVVGY